MLIQKPTQILPLSMHKCLKKATIYLCKSDSNGIRTHNHLVRKQTLNHLTKMASLANLAKWLRVRL